jgi:phosphohistidine phosphatase
MVLLVHHGDAVGPEVDPMRPLSRLGLAESASLASQAASRGISPDVIWHSGKIRALQTARLFRDACNPLAHVKAVRGLLPGDPAVWIFNELADDTRAIVLVGHMPHMAALLALLRGHADQTTTGDFPLHGCVALERQENGWIEVWRLGRGSGGAADRSGGAG